MVKEKAPAKLSALERVKAAYAKNDRASTALSAGAAKKAYTEVDGVPLPEGHPIRAITGLPCLPYNKVVQFAGKPDTGKSTLGSSILVPALLSNHKVIYWDTEEKFDAHRLEMLGGNADNIDFIRTNDIRIGGQLIKELIHAHKEDDPGCKILVVWDSVGGGVSRSDAERDLSDMKKSAQPGAAAKENGEVTRHIVSLMNVYRDSITMYMANQTYAKIGFMQKGDKAKGGDTIEFFSSLIVFMKRIKVLTGTENKQLVKKGIITEATVTKNHLSQGLTSVHKMRFEITASGVAVSTFAFKNEGSDDEGDDE
jgi:RecA/RadA recombinase